MVIFIVWNVLFAFELKILKTNPEAVKEIKGVPDWMGYWFTAFQNGIMGNIEYPNIDHW